MTSLPGLTPGDARRAARNIGVLVAASIFSKGLLFIWQIALGNWLGATDYGVYNTVFAVIAVLGPLASFNLGLILIREVARRPEAIGQYWGAALMIQTALTGLAYAACVLAASAAGYSDAIVAFTAIAALSLLVDVAGSTCNDLLLAQERMALTSAIDIAHIIIRLSLAIIALALGWGLPGLYIATLLAGLGRTMVLAGLIMRAGVRPQFPIHRPIAGRLLLDSLPLTAGAMLTLSYQHADKLMTTAILGETSTGYLGPAFVINFGIIEVLSTTVLVAIYPLMARLFDQPGPTFGWLAEKLTRYLLLAVLPLALALSLFAEDILGWLLRPEYAPTAGILRILIWYTAITMMTNVLSKALLIQNRQRLTLAARACGLALNLGLTAALLLGWRDPRGAVLASVCAEVLILVLLWLSFHAPGYDRWRLLASTGRVIGLALATGLAMLAGGVLGPIVGIGLGAVVYGAGLLFAPVLNEDDWDLLYRLAAAMPFGALVRRVWRRKTAITW